MSRSALSDQKVAESDGQTVADLVESMGQALEQWRSRIDELVLQLDLAKLDIREEVTKQLDIAQNVGLAASSRMSDARRVAGSNRDALRQRSEQITGDLRRACQEAEAVIQRG